MTTRRRLLGAGIALGLLPASAGAQDTSVKKYECQYHEGQTDKIYVNVIGTQNTPTDITGRYTLTMQPADITLGQGMTAFGEGPNGTVEFLMEQADADNPALLMRNISVKIQGLQYDRAIDPYTPTKVQATFMKADRTTPLFSFPVDLERFSGAESLQAHLGLDMLDHYTDGTFEATKTTTRTIHRHFTDIMQQLGTMKIVFHDPARGTGREDAILTYNPLSLSLEKIPQYLLPRVKTQLDRMKAGQCPEQSAPCFLTTAASHALGLPDDCWELETLRAFRDGPLMDIEGGPELVDRYYADAPAIVAARPLAENRALWTRTWLTGVLPAALLCRLGLNKLALRVYRRMVERLSAT